MADKKVVSEEAKNEDVTVEFREQKYTVPKEFRNWPLEAVEAQENGRMVGAVKELLGPEQYATLRKTANTVGDLEEFTEKLFDALDVDKGK